MVAKVIMAYLQENSIDEEWICQQAKLTPRRISGSLDGSKKLSIEEYTAVCRVLEISYDYFISLHRNAV